MTITVQLFGPYADAAGGQSLSVEMPGDHAATVGAVFEAIFTQTPELAPMKPVTRIAVNNRFVQPTQRIESGDEVALIGLVGGG
ncbi:MAG: MoaD/ThiS family protein [Phycisphaerales bacterium]